MGVLFQNEIIPFRSVFFAFLYMVIVIEPYVGMHDISGMRASHLTSASLDNVYVYVHELAMDTYN